MRIPSFRIDDLLLLIVQAVLCVIAFNRIVSHPVDAMFMNSYDGIKNYFTFAAYMQQEAEAGYFMLSRHAFPFGDYIFYADLTPAIALPLKWFSNNVAILSIHESIAIFNIIILSFQWFTPLVLVRVLRFFMTSRWLLLISAVALSWINPQVFRLLNGHFNLSLTMPLLLSLLFFLRYYASYSKTPNAKLHKRIKYLVGIAITLTISAYFHIYYLPIIGVMLGGLALGITAILWWKNKAGWLPSFRPTVEIMAACLVGGLLPYLSILLIDDYYGLRVGAGMGYGYEAWKLAFYSLYTARPFNALPFLFGANTQAPYESNLYLGGLFLYGASFITLACLLYKTQRSNILRELKGKPILWVFLGVSALGILIGLGETYVFDSGRYVFHNLLNPFKYLRKLSSTIEHFRCLARFVWPTFWLLNILMLYLIDRAWKQGSHFVVKAICIGLVGIMLVDTIDAIKFFNLHKVDNYFKAVEERWLPPSLQDIQPAAYQAIMPIPFFHGNAEVDGKIIDGGMDYNRYLFGLSLWANLPMLSAQSARMPTKHADHLFSIFINENGPDKAFLDKLNDKPILVLFHKRYTYPFADGVDFTRPSKEPAISVLANGMSIVEKYGMTLVGEDDNYLVYSWKVQ